MTERAWAAEAERLPDGRVLVTIRVRGSEHRVRGIFRDGGGPSALIARAKREPVVVACAGPDAPGSPWVVTDRTGRSYPVDTVDAAGLRLSVAVLPARTRRVTVRRSDGFDLHESSRPWWPKRPRARGFAAYQ
ncbi:hypothetical protein [Kitasatospora sp. NPDC093806]|uniref:hypothetical protein n=1 Tax=Kitasatospora sp. NPDC093806 TaxID=3155075 RepID=UPI00341D240F